MERCSRNMLIIIIIIKYIKPKVRWQPTHLCQLLQTASEVGRKGAGWGVEVSPVGTLVTLVCHKLPWATHLAWQFGCDTCQPLLKDVLSLRGDMSHRWAGQADVIKHVHLHLFCHLALWCGHLCTQPTRYYRGSFVGWLLQCPSNMLVYLRDGSAQTIVRVATQIQNANQTYLIWLQYTDSDPTNPSVCTL